MKKINNQKNCCAKINCEKETKGIWAGILYGAAPHTFCILFIIFTILGVATATAVLRPLLLNPYFFYLLIALSLIFATISAVIYLRRSGALSLQVIKNKWKYLVTLYGATVFINVLLFMVIFPITVNFSPGVSFTDAVSTAFGQGNISPWSASQPFLILAVDIPCPGHAFLIVKDLRAINGVESVQFTFPNLFSVAYSPQETSVKQILALDVFNTYGATVK